MVIRFGEFELDEARFELRRRGETVPVQRRVLETILYLATRAGRLVTREELANGPWRGTVVGNSAIARAIKEARAALGDTGETPNLIVTVRGAGFRFEGEVRGSEVGARPPVRASGRSSRAFTGREPELAELCLAWAEAERGQGSLVLVTGQPGIGKSSLLERFAEQTGAGGGDVHFGRCLEAQGTPPYWPWPELLQSYADRHGAWRIKSLAKDDLAELVSIAPVLARRVGAPATELTEGPYSGFRVLDAVARVCRSASQRRPLALVLEDAHLAEDSALDVIEHLYRSITDSRILLLVTARATEARERAKLRALLDGASLHARTLELRGLNKTDVSRWFEGAGAAADAHDLAERVTRVTDGHPLLIANLLRSLPPGFGAADLEQALARTLFIPENVSSSIRAELERLDPDVLELARTASVLGEEPWLPVLADLSERAPAALAPVIDRALLAGILERREAGRLRFRHALIREISYRGLTSERRLALHAAAASAIQARLESHPELIVEAAHHAMAASPCVEVNETVDLLVRAADWARRRLAFALASEHLRWALQTLDLGAPAPRRRAELLLKLAQSLHLAGRTEDAVRTYHELYEIGEANGYRDYQAEALLGGYDIRREGIIADATFQRRLNDRLADWGGRGKSYARLLATKAVVTPFLEHQGSRERWVEDALRLGRESGDSSARLAALHAASRVEFLDDARRAIGLAEEFKELAAKSGALDRMLDAAMWRADCLLRLGRGAEFEQEALELERLGRRLDRAHFAYVPALYRCLRRYLAGDVAAALAEARRAWSLGLPCVGILADSLLAGQLCLLAIELDGREREDVLRETVERVDHVLSHLPGFEMIRILSAWPRFEMGDRAEAARWLERVRADDEFLNRNNRNWVQIPDRRHAASRSC
jgi:DNA-binding winged helix-turn-helix (wHTH) protein